MRLELVHTSVTVYDLMSAMSSGQCFSNLVLCKLSFVMVPGTVGVTLQTSSERNRHSAYVSVLGFPTSRRLLRIQIQQAVHGFP
jgi:hypothetical protein